MNKIILASKSKVRKNILENNGIFCEVQPSNVDEEPVKESLIKEGASPEIVSKNLAELKANKVSNSNPEKIVLGADSVIDLQNNIISKPKDRLEAMKILKDMKRLEDAGAFGAEVECVAEDALIEIKKIAEIETFNTEKTFAKTAAPLLKKISQK